jgi:signal transduction histidine kinase/AmiR/NasT family two-component response regulator
MSPQPGSAEEARPRAPQAVAFAVHTRRNIFVQVTGLAMVIATALNVTPWPYVAGWAAAAVCVLGAEDQLLRAMGRGGPNAAKLSAWAPAFRIAGTTLYATAALTLIVRGGGPERLFAVALICASCVHVLMRHYRRPWTLVGALSPYIAILLWLAVQQVRLGLAAHHLLAAAIGTFTLGTFALQFWSARGQLNAAWTELQNAREAAEARERAAEAASRAKSNFLAIMSHELRTPLNGVLGMAQALTLEKLSDSQRERVKVIRRSSESLLAVLNDLLDLSKIETSSLELEVGEFDLEHLVRGVVAAYEPLAQKKGLAFSFQVSEAACGHYLGDSARIRRILYSLADNAVKFTDAGGVMLGVQRDGDHLVFRVDDSGIGIEESALAHLFEGFFQADASLSRRHGGAGLGLAICREMSQLMGGSIEAISEFGAGSTFIVRLPLAPAPAAAQAPAAETAPAEESGGALRVLAAEDNDTNQLVLKTLLAQCGVDVTLVENGQQAVEAWEAQTWDIILMDIQMPVMDGVVATRAIREGERTSGRARTPILAVTANAMTHQVAEYEAAGMDGMVPKPLDITALLAAMQKALEPAEADQQFTARSSAA